MPPEDWIKVEVAAGPGEEQLLAYFGLTPPPDPDRLDVNVKAKRQYWRKMESCPNPKGRQRAARVQANIKNHADALLRGAPTVFEPSPEELEELTATVVPEGELLDHVFGLLMEARLDDAIRVSVAAQSVYPGSWVPFAAHGYAVSVGVDTGRIARSDTINAGMASLEKALQRKRDEPLVWEAAAVLLLAQGRFGDVLSTASAAARSLREVPAAVIARAGLAHLGMNHFDDGLIDAVRAVMAAPADLALRGLLAEGIVRLAAFPLLPLRDEEAKNRYVNSVATAAWCARGVPEAENLVRPHRLWAAKCDTMIFNGSYGLRTLLATLTLFLSPIVHNRISAKPAWWIYLQGPAAGTTFEFLAGSPDVVDAHRGAPKPPSWHGVDDAYAA